MLGRPLFSHVTIFCTLLYFQQHSKKKKKEKKEKRDKKDKKKRKDKLKADYEEAEGITTPSKERLTPSQLDTPITTKVCVIICTFKIKNCSLYLTLKVPSKADDSHEMSRLVFSEKIKNKKLSFAAVVTVKK